VSWVRRHATAVSVVVLAALAFVPALTAAPGRMPSDSKLYVYLNPGRFLADTTTTMDPRQFAGWVPHQHISYLWPAGPWFWVFDSLGVPDWIAHRLWIAMLLVMAGLGVRWMARVIGLAPLAALVAAIVYQLSPYILPYVSRTSVLLLPFAGLGWIVGCTALAAARGRWRYAALVALAVFTVGSVNATALAMIIPAPVLWLAHTTWRGDVTWRRAAATAGKVALASIGVSLWWIAMLVVQGRYGADVLAYSESLASVSFTSTSTEVIRGLGYWLFYIRDAFDATTTASIDYLLSTGVILAGIALLACCLAGLIATTWAHRRFAALLVGVGTVLAVGVHPIEDPSPVMGVLVGDGEGGLALALRSSTRAVPVLVLGLALGAGMAVSGLRTRRWTVAARAIRLDAVAAVAVSVAAVAYLPALRTGGFVDPALERDQDPPDAWVEAAAALDALPDGFRVLALPGTEFGAYTWGYTVDQPLPALTERPLLTRDLLPLGSAAAMDLVFALDDRFQDGVAEIGSVAPVARLLGVDTVWVTGDVDADRFRLARPELVDALLTAPSAGEAGLIAPERFGVPAVNPAAPDEAAVGDERVGAPTAPVTLVGIAEPVPTVRVKTDEVVLSGDGAGIVDAAAAGLIDGTELIRYSASLEGDALVDALESASRLIVTDTNRARAHHWRSSQDVTGFTEAGGEDGGVLRFESGDQRLPVFGDTTDEATQTVSVQVGPVVAAASAYGEPFAYLPEHRPSMAIDGDPATSWVVADRGQPVGEYIVLTTDDGVDHVTFRQPDTAAGARTITAIELTVDDRTAQRVELDDTSRTGAGQRVDIEPTDGPTTITVEIAAVTAPQPAIGAASGAVGFSEIDLGLGPTVEFIRPPIDGLDASTSAPDTPVEMVFTRLRIDPTDRWRSDPEPVMRRVFPLERAADFDMEVTLRLDRRLDGAALADLLGEPVVDDGHLLGTRTARGAAAVDHDPATSWITPFGAPTGHSIHLRDDGTADSITIEQPAGDFSRITEITLSDAAGSQTLAVTDGAIDLPRAIELTDLTIEITRVEEATTLDRRFGDSVVLPAAIAEIRFDDRSPAVRPADTIAFECRDDLLRVDGEPVGLSVNVATADLLAGDAVVAEVCDEPTWVAGDHEIVGSADAAFSVDRVVLAEPVAAPDTLVVKPTVTTSSRTGSVVEVPPCPTGCWLVFGEGFNTGWTASTDAGSLGVPQLVDGNANGWYLDPSTTATTVTIGWPPQRVLNVALALTAVALLAACALVIADRRRPADSAVMPEPIGLLVARDRTERRSLVLAAVVATVTSAVAIDWRWALLAAVAGASTIAARRMWPMGVAGGVLVVGAQLAVLVIVRRDRPYPNAGWPVRFEWLHGWTLLGVVLVTCATLFAADASRRDR
jgi:arabinofuranan 3-O-arabinosyltransferase